RRALIRRCGQVPAAAERGETGELEAALPGRIRAAGFEQLVAGALEDIACDLLERECVVTAHLASPVAESRRRRLGGVGMLGHVCGVARARVVEHGGLPGQGCVLADATQPLLRLADQILVAELEISAARVPAEPPRREDLRAPPRRELRNGARLCPRLAGE